MEVPQVRQGICQTESGPLLRKAEDADAYIAIQDEAVQPRLREVRDILRAALPEARERMSWSMPTYRKDRDLIHFAASKMHLGLYPGGEATMVFTEELKDFDVSKGTMTTVPSQTLRYGTKHHPHDGFRRFERR